MPKLSSIYLAQKLSKNTVSKSAKNLKIGEHKICPNFTHKNFYARLPSTQKPHFDK